MGPFSISECHEVRELISAQLDDELASTGEFEYLNSHLAGCQRCSTWKQHLVSINGQSRVIRTELVPDLSGKIFARIAQETRTATTPSVLPMAQLGLVIVSIALLVGALASLVTRNPEVLLAGGAHTPQELFGFQFALSVGFAGAAWKPQWAGGIALSSAVAAVVLVVTAFTGMGNGTTTGTLEFNHVLEVAGALLAFVIARQSSMGSKGQRVGSLVTP